MKQLSPKTQSYPSICNALARLAAACCSVALLSGSPAGAQHFQPNPATQVKGQPAAKPQPNPDTYEIDQIGAWGGRLNAFVRDGDIAYAGSGQRLVTLDMSDPNNPTEIGSVLMGTLVFDIEVRDGYAYVVTDGSHAGLVVPDAGLRQSGFHVVDARTPSSPRVIWSILDPANILQSASYKGFQIELHENFAVTHGYFGMHFIDITNPEQPAVISRDDVRITGLAGSLLHQFNDFVIRDGLMYVASTESLGFLRIYDLSSINPSQELPLQPPLIGFEPFGPSRELTHVVVEGDYAYVTVEDNSDLPGNEPAMELWVMDISDPTDPRKVGSYDDLLLLNGSPVSPSDIAVSDGRLYITYPSVTSNTSFFDGLTILDVATDPANPTLLGTYNTHGSLSGVQTQADGTLLLHDAGEGLIIADASDPSDIRRIGGYYSPEGFAGGVQRGDLLYLVNVWNGLDILDVSDPQHPQHVGTYQTEAGVGVGNNGLTLDEDGYAYLGVGRGGLDVIDITDPSQPTLAGRMRFPSDSWQAHGLTLRVMPDGAKVIFFSVSAQDSNCSLMFSLDVTDPGAITQLDVICVGVQDIYGFEGSAPGIMYMTGRTDEDGDDLPETVLSLDFSDPSDLLLHAFDATEAPDSPSNYASLNGALDERRNLFWYTMSGNTHAGLYCLDLDATPDPQAVYTRMERQFSAIEPHPIGLLIVADAPEFLDGAIFNRLVLLNTADPANPMPVASAVLPTSITDQTPSDSSLIVDGRSVYALSRYKGAGLTTLSVRAVLDRDLDGRVTANDLTMFIDELRRKEPLTDLNKDGVSNYFDLRLFIARYMDR